MMSANCNGTNLGLRLELWKSAITTYIAENVVLIIFCIVQARYLGPTSIGDSSLSITKLHAVSIRYYIYSGQKGKYIA